jgi:hypothetical protein
MNLHRVLVGVLVLGAPLTVAWAQSPVSAPGKRQAALDQASLLLAPRQNPAASLPADLVDPFNPPAPGIQATSGPVKPGEVVRGGVTNRDILQRLAPRITPSGVLLFGGQPMLLFREKRLKVGDTLKITVEGAEYSVTISAIDPTSFKIRLNGDEVTRPIKPGKVP